MDPIFSKPLKDATVQEIQLELIRRSTYNAFDGEKIAASLLRHRELWRAVILDRIAIMRPGKLPASGLIKLRDLDENLWNADTLYILSPNKARASKLVKIIEKEDWGGMVTMRHDAKEVDMALGGAEDGQAVVRIWWD